MATKHAVRTVASKYTWRPIILTSGIVLLLGLALAYMVFRFQVNPDGLSYINTAERYAAFDFGNALNGYWGVLISWLLVPFVWLKADPVISFYFISLICSALTVLLLHKFALNKLSFIKPLPLYLVELTLLLILSSLSLSVLTPDILLTLAFTFLLFSFSNFDDKPTRRNGIILGLAGALLFFAKPAGLLLFLFALIAYAIYIFLQKKTKIRALLTTLLVFFILVVPYCTALSIKYNQPIFSTSNSYNLSLISPTYQRQHTITQPGIYLPPNQYANSVWDDPSNLPIKHWNPLASPSDFKYYTNEVLFNFHSLATFIQNLGIIILLGLSVVISTVVSRKQFKIESFIGTVLAVGLLGLYSLSVVDPRHMWPIIPLAFIGILIALDYTSKQTTISTKNLPMFIAFGILMLSIPLITPVSAGKVVPPYVTSAQALARNVEPGARLVSDDAGAMFVCFRSDTQCNGILPTDASANTIAYLQKNNIQYLLLLNGTSAYNSVIEDYYELVDPTINLYKLKV
ncbi:MAG: hypothetical protein JWO54_669 [Candidatus Saccharibacteria bacterium]|nr:hypothetical protein [Candidatus Saccharibacteria bacterium]